MSSKLKLALELILRDKASRETRRAMGEIDKSAEKVVQRMKDLGIQEAVAERNLKSLQNTGRRALGGLDQATDKAARRMRHLTREATLAQKAYLGLQRAGQAVAAGAAFKAVVSPAVSRTMDYSTRLAHMANTAFSDRDTAGRIAGKRALDAAIDLAVRQGGGTREDAASALDAIIASGAIPAKAAMAILPSVQKAAVGGNADPTEIAMIGVRAMQSFGIQEDRMGKVFDMALTAGQLGGFEIKDMAKWLPQQMATALMSGLSGEAGLAKLNSQDTANDAKKLGIDLSGTLANARAKGMDSLTAFVALVDRIVAKDKRYTDLQAKLKTATAKDKKAVYESMANILEGSAIGKIVQDRQALGALLGLLNNREYVGDVERKTLAASGSVEANKAVLNAEAGIRVQAAVQEKNIAMQAALENVNHRLGETALKLVEYAQKYPELTTSLAQATTALTALAAAAGAAGLAGMLMGGKGLAKGVAASPLTGKLSPLLRRAAPVAIGLGAFEFLSGMGEPHGGPNGGLNGGKVSTFDQAAKDRARRMSRLRALDFTPPELKVSVDVDVKNGNIVAEVNKANARQARRN